MIETRETKRTPVGNEKNLIFPSILAARSIVRSTPYQLGRYDPSNTRKTPICSTGCCRAKVASYLPSCDNP